MRLHKRVDVDATIGTPMAAMEGHGHRTPVRSKPFRLCGMMIWPDTMVCSMPEFYLFWKIIMEHSRFKRASAGGGILP